MIESGTLPRRGLVPVTGDAVVGESGGNVVLAAEFGTFNNDGLLQYMRTGSGTVYMMSSFVGKEWETAAKAAMP